MKLIIGLGNPGQSYKDTRHNIGFLTIDRYAQRRGAQIKKEKYNSFYAGKTFRGQKIVLAKPATFMNLSGEAVRLLARKFRVSFESILVVCDDVNLDFGVLRMRPKGTSGGHHGLESIIGLLGTNDFSRIRIGVGGGEREDLSEYVLEPFDKAQAKKLEQVLETACDAIDVWLKEGTVKAMNKFNAKAKEKMQR